MNTPRSVILKKLGTAALARIVAQNILPEGHREGDLWIAPSPHRRAFGEELPFTIRLDLVSGGWTDDTFDVTGEDPLSLFTYVHGCGENAAFQWIAEILGVEAMGRQQ